MIADTLAHSSLYHAAHPLFASAFAYLAAFNPSTPDGEYPLGDGSEARVMTYVTKPRDAGRWESHRQYIDIQYMVAGIENMLCAPSAMLETSTEYDAAKDLMFYTDIHAESATLTVRAGSFTIFFPHDAHIPGIAVGDAQEVRKIVMKVPVR